jgi:predicted alpha/beta-hydrolase family hydrolase
MYSAFDVRKRPREDHLMGTPDHSPVPAQPALWFDGPIAASKVIALAHGAGAGMDTPFLNAFAAGLAQAGWRVARFEFPYMAGARRSGRKKPPDREPELRQTWLEVVEVLKSPKLIIGGKSMGGRIASLVADEVGAARLVCLGYPFHPTGKPDQLRIAHLQTIKTPTLILQGTRDPFGSREEVERYSPSSSIAIHGLEDGNHDLAPRKASGRTTQRNWEEAVAAVVSFVERA